MNTKTKILDLLTYQVNELDLSPCIFFRAASYVDRLQHKMHDISANWERITDAILSLTIKVTCDVQDDIHVTRTSDFDALEFRLARLLSFDLLQPTLYESQPHSTYWYAYCRDRVFKIDSKEEDDDGLVESIDDDISTDTVLYSSEFSNVYLDESDFTVIKRYNCDEIYAACLRELAFYQLTRSEGSDFILSDVQIKVNEVDRRIYLVMPAACGDLTDKLDTDDVDVDIFRKMALSVNFLTDRGLLHSDIKLSNFLYFDDIIYLVDYGFLIRINELEKSSTAYTYPYRPPEVIQEKPYTEKADVWALGVCFLYLYLKTTIIPTHEDDKSLICHCFNLANQIDHIRNLRLRRVIGGMLRFDPKQRWSIKDVIVALSSE